MNHGASQPTLDGLPRVGPADGIESLHLIEAAALLALGRSTKERAPATPSSPLTLELAEWLERRGVIALCTDRAAASAAHVVRSIYDPLAWRYCWATARDSTFLDLLSIRVRELAGGGGLASKRVLWRTLADAELEAYLGNLLRRHGFPAEWAIDLRDGNDRWDSGHLNLAQMRYVVWASVREGAAAFMRAGGLEDEAREAIAREIRRRSAWIETRPDWGGKFVPAPGGLQSILLTVFLEEIAPLGNHYWTTPPTEAGLRLAAGPQGQPSGG